MLPVETPREALLLKMLEWMGKKKIEFCFNRGVLYGKDEVKKLLAKN